MADQVIFDEGCLHNWKKKEFRDPLSNKLIASWEVCSKCGSEKSREVYK